MKPQGIPAQTKLTAIAEHRMEDFNLLMSACVADSCPVPMARAPLSYTLFSQFNYPAAVEPASPTNLATWDRTIAKGLVRTFGDNSRAYTSSGNAGVLLDTLDLSIELAREHKMFRTEANAFAIYGALLPPILHPITETINRGVEERYIDGLCRYFDQAKAHPRIPHATLIAHTDQALNEQPRRKMWPKPEIRIFINGLIADYAHTHPDKMIELGH